MKKQLALFVSGVLFVAMPIASKQIDLAEAEKIALNWMHSKYPYRDISLAPLQRQLLDNPTNRPNPTYYTITMKPSGWVIVSGENALKPVIGYSLNSSNNPYKKPPAFIDWMRGVSNDIKRLQSLLPNDAKPSREWRLLSNGRMMLSSILGSGQTYKLLKTPTWGQGQYYNELTPKDSSAKKYTDNNHVPTGCIATAMAEIMRYHKWPKKGKGSHTDDDSGYGSLTVDFGSYTYDWDSMPMGKLTSSNEEVAKIMYHLGVATDMQYTPAGSGTLADFIIPAFTNYFSYDASIGLKSKNETDSAKWAQFIKNDIDNNLPVLYAGMDDNGFGGHAFVCDGYDSSSGNNEFHFNWGWDGEKNGWFAMGSLGPEDTGAMFNTENMAFFGIVPTNRKPIIMSMEPSTGVVPGIGVTIKGKNFYTDANDKRYVTVSGQKVPVTQWTNTMITFNAPETLGPVVIHNESGDSEPKNFGMWVKQKVVPQHAHGLVHATVGNRVYFFGDGEAFNEFSKSVEVFDSNENIWMDSGDADTSFTGASAAEHNGSIYIAGINNENDFIYDENNNTFSEIAAGSSVPSDYGKLIKINDTLYYLGGQNNDGDTNKVYKLNGNSWVPAGQLSSKRSRFAAVTVGQTVYLFGGRVDGDWYQKSIEKCDIKNDNMSCEKLDEEMPEGYVEIDAFTNDDNSTIIVFETSSSSDTQPRAFKFSIETDKVMVPNSPYALGKLLDKFSVFKHDGGFIAFGTDENGYVIQFATNGSGGNSQSVKVPSLDDDISINEEINSGGEIEVDISEEIGDLDANITLVVVKKPMLGKVTINGTAVTYKSIKDLYYYDASDTVVLRLENNKTKSRSLKAVTLKYAIKGHKHDEGSDGGGGGGGGGGGCSYNPDTHSIDITMLLMLMVSLLYPFVRRRNI